METTQDKQIREKLNSLNSLPEGYAPSLDSKWELLLAGQPKKPESKSYIWWAAAACLLFLLGFGYRFLKLSTQENTKTVASQSLPEKVENKTETPIKIQPKKLDQTFEKAIANVFVKAKNGRVLAVKTQVAKQISKPEANIIPEPGKVELVLPIAENSAPFIAAETPKTSLKKKNKFVEMDFDSPETVTQEPQNLETAQLTFKIKFLSRENNPMPAETQTEKLLRLQHTF